MRVKVDGQSYDVPDDATPEEIDQISRPAAAPQEGPGLLRRALSFMTTPSDNYRKAVIDPNATAGNGGAAFPLTKESGDPRTAAQAFLSGIPGYHADESPGAQDRMRQFGEQHGAASVLLPLAGGLANPVLPSGAASVASAPERLANSLAARTLRGTAGEYRQLGKQGTQDVGDFLLRNNAVRFGSSPAAVAERVSSLPESTGKSLGTAVEALDQTGAQVSKNSLAQQFSALAEQARAGGPGAAPLVAKYNAAAQAVLDDIEKSGQPMMSFKQAEQWKQAYQAPINYAKKTNTPLEMGAKEVASAARQGVEDAASTAAPGTELGQQFLNAKRESGLAQRSAAMAEGATGRNLGRNMMAPSAKAGSMLALTTALMSGHADPLHLGAAALSGPALQFLSSRAPASAAVLLKSIAPGLGKTAAQGAATDVGTILREALRNRSRMMPPEFASNE